ncbi:MAG: hypothetical protein OXE87_07170 [Chloroflexi bacterium]|nr:hypothetical protein [Chloroflexota bacterium]
MLPAFLTDTRIEHAQRKIICAQDSSIESLQTLVVDRPVEHYGDRPERAEAELERLRSEPAERDNELAARVRRLELAAGLTLPDASSDATEI